MSRSLFIIQDPQIGRTYSSRAYNDSRWNDFYRLRKRVNLKEDLRWREVENLQRILRGSDIWDEFPAAGLTLVDAEFKGGDEEQRIDLLYLRNDGGLLPCELKIGGQGKDTHGQLIRYMADLSFQTLDMEFLIQRQTRFLESISDAGVRDVHHQKFRTFLERHQVCDKFIRLLPKAGIIMDEGFPTQMLKAVRFLNNSCGFSIRLLEIRAFVAEEWTPDSNDFFMRIDFVDIQ